MNNFDFEAERQRLIENLNYLKSLKGGVKEYTFYKKWDELRHHIEPQQAYIQEAFRLMWCPPLEFVSDENVALKAISQIKPRLIFVGDKEIDETNFRYWEAYCFFLSSHANNGVPGRFFRILIIDENAPQKRILGIAAIASDVNSIGCRDKFIGWTPAQRTAGMLNHTAIGSTIVPTQPFGFNFLGGKLIAALLTTQTVRDEWQLRYGDVLAGLTTTSLYGPSSMYNAIPWWKTVGATTGSIPIQPDVEIYYKWRAWVRKHRRKEFVKICTTKQGRSGPATSEKTRVLDLIFKTVGISTKQFEHGFERGVFFSSFYENTKDFLCQRISEQDLKLKPRLQNDIQGIMDWWLPRAIRRYLILKEKNALKESSPFYDDTASMDYETARAKYFNDVGR